MKTISEYRQYTIHGDYSATGEGLTAMLMYVMATNEAEAYQRAKDVFGPFYSLCLTVEEGVNTECSSARFLLSDPVRKMIEEKNCFVYYYSSMHFNMS